MFTQHSPNLLLLAGKTSSVVSAIPTLNLLDGQYVLAVITIHYLTL